MKKINKFIKKILTREIIFYIIFGILTTIVNILVSYILKTIFEIEGNLASTIGIICSIIFAYFTNRKLVFNSEANKFKEKFVEFGKFVFGRAFTMIIEILGVFFLNNIIHMFYSLFDENIAYLINKCIITVIVIVLNFFISKFFAFKTKKVQ